MATKRPLKKNTASGLPRQFNVSEDLVGAAGLDIEALGTHTITKDGNDIKVVDPNIGTKTLKNLESTVRISSNDSTAADLISKLVAGSGIQLTELNDAGNETLEISLATLTPPEKFTDEGKDSTTSNGWVSKISVTTSNLPAGDYLLFHQAEIGQTDEGKRAGYRVQVDGTSICDVRDGLSVDDQYLIRSGHYYIDDHPGGTIDLDMDYGQTDDGGTMFIRDARITIIRVA